MATIAHKTPSASATTEVRRRAPQQGSAAAQRSEPFEEMVESQGFLSALKGALESAGVEPEQTTARAQAFKEGVKKWMQHPESSYANLSDKGIAARSIRSALLQIASTGLDVDPYNKLAWVTPKRQSGQWRAVPMPGVRGLEKKVFEAGLLKKMASNETVREQDKFECVMGSDPKIVHTKNLFPDPSKPNAPIGSYAVGVTPDGDKLQAVWPRDPAEMEELMQQRSRSSGYMDDDTAIRYKARRQLLKEAVNTLGHSPDMAQLRTMNLAEEQSQDEEQQQGVGEGTAKERQPEQKTPEQSPHSITAPSL
jgi:hypothetical protein